MKPRFKIDPVIAREGDFRRRAASIGCTTAELTAHLAAGHWRCPGRRNGDRVLVARHWVTDEPPTPFRTGSERSQCSSCRAGRAPRTAT